MDCQQSPKPSVLWNGDHEPQRGPQRNLFYLPIQGQQKKRKTMLMEPKAGYHGDEGRMGGWGGQV